MEKYKTRIDKWLWSVRIFKTRQLATNACNNKKVKVNNITTKASRNIQINDSIQVQKGSIKYIYNVKKIAEKRMAAKLVSEFLDDLTPQEEIDKATLIRKQIIHTRKKGQGRPTKKERRTMDKIRNKY